MKGQIETGLGTILINHEVIATYAGSVAVGCFGIVGMAAVNMKDGLVRLLKKDYITREFDSFIFQKILTGLIKPGFFMSNFLFYYIAFYCNVL